MTDFSKFKTQELTKPRDKAWSEPWYKGEKVGDKITGIVRDVFVRPPEGDFKIQRAFTLEQADGKLTNVGMKREPYFAIRPTNDVRLGDLLTIELTELRPSKTKGYSATKIYSFVSGTLPENDGNKTVKELEMEDAKSQGLAHLLGMEEVEKEITTNEVSEALEEVPFK
jgi:hypothetical protein